MVLKKHHNTNKSEGRLKPPDYDILRPYLLFVDNDTIRQTIDATTQYGLITSTATQLKNTFRSPFPALNVFSRNETVATDPVYSNVPAIDNESRLAQVFDSRRTLMIDAYSLKTETQFVSTLQENIRKKGAMNILISDRAKIEISK